jgi:hypothetical protein
VEFYRDKELEDEIVAKIVTNWGGGEREDIHLSDLISPRKAYFNKKLKLPPTKDEIFTFLVGLGVEDKLGSLMGDEHAATEIRHGIHFSPDFRLPDITELKSRRRGLAKEGSEYDHYSHYLRQLTGYMALTEERSGNLLVFSIAERFDESGKTKPELAAYRLRCTEDELTSRLEDLLYVKDRLIQALETNDYTRLPLCEDWLCGRSIKHTTLLPSCITCNREFGNDHLLKKHKEGKRSLDHEVKYGTYEYTFEPMCKYFDVCGRTVNE